MISVGSGEREREGFLFGIERDMNVSVQKTISKIKFTLFSFFSAFNLLLPHKYHARYNHSLTKSNSFI